MKIKIILTIFTFSFMTLVQAECNKKINNSKVMLFVDVNESGEEIDTAEKAACERGQRLVVVPENYKEYEKALEKSKKFAGVYSNCLKKNSQNCAKEQGEAQKSRIEYIGFAQSETPIGDKLKNELLKLKKENASLENFTISGHDGGGHFGGAKGGIGRNEVLDIMKDFKDINNVKSVLLLGCYTGVPKQIMDWSMVFPDLRILGGYDGSAPLASRPEGHEYLYDLLMNEKALTSDADQKRLQSVINKNFDSLKYLNASMYLRPACQSKDSEKSFYYGKARGPELKEYELNECLKSTKELSDTKAILDRYYAGDVEPPADTVKGEMRTIYNTARRFEHCKSNENQFGNLGSQNNSIVSAQRAFGLLFFEGFKENFSNLYDEDMKEAEKIIAAIDKKEMDAVEVEYNKTIEAQEKNLAEYQADMNLLQTNPTAYAAAKKEVMNGKIEEYKKLAADPKAAKILKNFPMVALDYESANGSIDDIEMMSKIGALAPDELQLFEKFYEKKQEISLVGRMVKSAGDPVLRNAVIQSTGYSLNFMAQSLEARKLMLANGKIQMESLQKIWMPTKENMKGKTRKEIMDNAHAMSGVLATPLLPEKTRNALMWANNKIQQRLVELEAPFSWHEYTGTVEAPLGDIKLEAAMKNQIGAGGYPMGMGGGGYYPVRGGWGEAMAVPAQNAADTNNGGY